MPYENFLTRSKLAEGLYFQKNGVSSQCEILLHKASVPNLFKENDLVFLAPDAALFITEVKYLRDRKILKVVIDALKYSV